VAQKGSLVNEAHLRFDFSHFAKVSDEEVAEIEKMVNQKIRQNIPVVIRELPKEEAVALGAMALFGEKYGDVVRVVTMDPSYSVELCGGTHIGATGELGFFKITHEAAVAAGVRRIEAVSGGAAEQWLHKQLDELHRVKHALKAPKDAVKAIEKLHEDLAATTHHAEMLEARMLVGIRNEVLTKDQIINGVTLISEQVEVSSADALRRLCMDVKHHLNDAVVLLGTNINGKPFVALSIDDKVVAARGLDASAIIKQHLAPLIKGGGGGQKNFATAGGQELSGLGQAIAFIGTLL
jgi:alanyl-tRNA synthetase